MNRKKQMQKAFGVDEFGHFNFPIKIPNVRLARLMYGNKSGCSYCFSHGYETVNSTVANRQRNWKRFRKIKWKDKLSYKKPQHLGLFICICLANEIKNEWWFKGKPIASPDRKHFIGMYTVYDFKRFEYWLVLFDKTKKELIRHLVYKERAELFVISHLSWQDREHIVYKFDGPQKLFTYSIDDLLQSRVAKLPEKIHLMFK